jgi:hypothetical protein
VIFLQHALENGNSAAAMGRIVLDVAAAGRHKDSPMSKNRYQLVTGGPMQ